MSIAETSPAFYNVLVTQSTRVFHVVGQLKKIIMTRGDSSFFIQNGKIFVPNSKILLTRLLQTHLLTLSKDNRENSLRVLLAL
jgi:hypothetical protein